MESIFKTLILHQTQHVDLNNHTASILSRFHSNNVRKPMSLCAFEFGSKDNNSTEIRMPKWMRMIQEMASWMQVSFKTKIRREIG